MTIKQIQTRQNLSTKANSDGGNDINVSFNLHLKTIKTIKNKDQVDVIIDDKATQAH